MNQMLAFCGLMCDECPAYKATTADSDELRKSTAELWSKMFGGNIPPEEINCLGCRSDVLFSHCKVCEIRACSLEKQLDHCGSCESFSCAKVEGILKHDQGARERLLKAASKTA